MTRAHPRQESVPSGTRPAGAGRWRLGHLALILAAVLATTAWFLYAEHEIAREWGYSLDDSWIYATFAKNLATGHGYSFNPGEHIAGATGPLYVFILAFLYWIFGSVILPAKVLGILCLCASSFLLYRSAVHVLPGSKFGPLVAGLLLAMSPVLTWGALSGMEIPVYLLVASLGIHAYARERWTLAVFWWSLGVWLRPDGILLALIALVASPDRSLRRLAQGVSVAGLVIVPYLIFNYAVGHSLLPSTVGIKAHLEGNILSKEWGVFRQWLEIWGLPLDRNGLAMHATLLLPVMAVGAALSLRRLPALAIYQFGFPLAFGLIGGGGGQYGRYVAHVIPFGILLALIGLDHVFHRARGRIRELGVVVLGVFCLTWEARSSFLVGPAHGWNVQNINGMQRYIAETFHEVLTPGDTVAVNDVGAMGYFSGCYVVDLVGLVSPRRSFPENLSIYRPKALAIFPQWFEPFATIDPLTKRQVFWSADSAWKYSPTVGIKLRKNTISGRNTMYIYERLAPGEEGDPHVQMILH
jgi:hypothetical protein